MSNRSRGKQQRVARELAEVHAYREKAEYEAARAKMAALRAAVLAPLPPAVPGELPEAELTDEQRIAARKRARSRPADAPGSRSEEEL